MNEYREIRVSKRDNLIEAGHNPYPSKTPDRISCAEAKTRLETHQAVSGRVLAMRSMGKVVFIDVHDESGKIQAFLHKKSVDSNIVDQLDLGDIVYVKGEVKTTKTKEITVFANEFKILTKSLAVPPMPDKSSTVTNTETKYRKRYLDLISNKESRDLFRKRSAIIANIREFLNSNGYMEVETPMMHSIAGGAKAKPFVTKHNSLDMNLFLRVAPELHLKRLLVGGFEKIYEINRSFRNEGIDTTHNPEFTMLEVYAAYQDCDYMMALVKSIVGQDTISWRGHEIDLSKHSIITYKDMLESGVQENDLIQPTFIVDFPKEESPLAKAKEDDPNVCERFELIIGGMEIANAFSELNDPDEQLKRFKTQIEIARTSNDDEVAKEIDNDYIDALEVGLPPAAGLGIGIDRLIMLHTGAESIRDVILFPQMRKQ